MPDETPALVLEANSANLRQATEFVREGAAAANLPEHRLGELDLVVEELFLNVCMHAYPERSPGTVAIRYRVPSPGDLEVEIADRGQAFDPLSAMPANVTLDLEQRPIGGLGIHLVKNLTRSLAYCREDGWNRLTFAVSAAS